VESSVKLDVRTGASPCPAVDFDQIINPMFGEAPLAVAGSLVHRPDRERSFALIRAPSGRVPPTGGREARVVVDLAIPGVIQRGPGVPGDRQEAFPLIGAQRVWSSALLAHPIHKPLPSQIAGGMTRTSMGPPIHMHVLVEGMNVLQPFPYAWPSHPVFVGCFGAIELHRPASVFIGPGSSSDLGPSSEELVKLSLN
jgi:hypothetical protein